MTTEEFLYVLTLGLAGASLFKLFMTDRITQAIRYWLWRRLNHRGFVAYHFLYVTGCALCLPMWVAIGGWLLRDYEIVRALVFILAGRMVAWVVLCYLNQTTQRDLPDSHDFPPARRRPL